jgi:GDPmannose 4,6-dehydratase
MEFHERKQGAKRMKALITGITGQDGSYLAEFLLSRGYEVHGTVRPASLPRFERINHIIHRLRVHEADISDQLSLVHLMEEIRPDEIYNLAGHSRPEISWQQPVVCGDTHGLGVVRLLEAARLVHSPARIFQASSAAMFGIVTESPQNERTPFRPVTPFGIAKLYAHRTATIYRHRYGMHICCGILYDHESPRRSREFVTRQITRAAARIKLGLQEKLIVPTLDMRSDRGFAGDFVRAFWMMLQCDTPDDYIIATNKTWSLEDVCRFAFEAVDLDWHDYVRVENASAAADTPCPLQGDTAHARRTLLWEPEVSFDKTVAMMVEADLDRHSPPSHWSREVIPAVLAEEDNR